MTALGNCGNSVNGIGIQKCIKGNPLKMPNKAALAVEGFQFDTYADFMNEDLWNAAIAAGNIFILEKFKAVETANVEAIIIDTPSGDKIKNRDGRRGWIGYMDMTPEQNKYFQQYENSNWTLFSIDDQKNILATSPDGTVVKGLAISYFNPMPMEIATGTDSYSRTGLEIQFDNNDDIDQYVVIALGTSLDWNPQKLLPTTLVNVSDVSISTNTITFSLAVVQGTIASKPSVAVTGVTATELQFIDQTGTIVVADSITESATVPGTYIAVMTGAAMTSGSLQLVATADSLYYSTITVVA